MRLLMAWLLYGWYSIENLSLKWYIVLLSVLIVLILNTAIFYTWPISEYGVEGIIKTMAVLVLLSAGNLFSSRKNHSLANQFVWCVIEYPLNLSLAIVLVPVMGLFFSFIIVLPLVVQYKRLCFFRDLFEKQFPKGIDTKLYDCLWAPPPQSPQKP